MTGMLASVRSLAEARQALATGVDIIDLKEPSAGSLGALDTATIIEVVTAVAGQCPVSATIGDMPMQPDLIYDKVEEIARTGVDYIKIGLLPDTDADNVITRLSGISARHKLIAVMFADIPMNLTDIAKLYQAGFCGVMLDTFDKRRGSLTGIMPISAISTFVHSVKNLDILCGLAGSLTAYDIPVLLRLQPEYLGFRGALCGHGDRTGLIDESAIKHIKQVLSGSPCR
jgi:(5-formylfuran-3-yl)methyl phosphate synthase